MDIPKGDRHRNRSRNHASGAEKRRKVSLAKEESAKLTKIRRFLVQPPQVRQTSDRKDVVDVQVADNTGDVIVTESPRNSGDANVIESADNTSDDNRTNANNGLEQPPVPGGDIGRLCLLFPMSFDALAVGCASTCLIACSWWIF